MHKFFSRYCIALFALVASTPHAWGASGNWLGGAAGNDMTTAANWSAGVPGAADTGSFLAVGATTPNLLTTAVTPIFGPGSFNFTAAAQAYNLTISGAGVALNFQLPAGASNVSANNQNFFINTAGTLSFAAATTPGNTHQVNYNLGTSVGGGASAGGNLTFNGDYTDASFTNIDLKNTSTLSILGGGVVQVNSVTSDATSTINLGTGDLQINYSGVPPITLAGPISGATLDMVGTGTLILTNTGNTQNQTSVNTGGTLIASPPNAAPNGKTVLLSGIFEMDGPGTNTSSVLAGTGAVQINTNGGAGTTVIMSGPFANYSGGTTISSGTLQATPANLPVGGPALQGAIIDNATFDLEQPAGTASFTGVISGTGNVNINAAGGTGTIVLTPFAPPNTYAGGGTPISGTTVFNGILSFGNSGAVPGSPTQGILIQAPGTVNFPLSLTYGGPISGAGGIIVNNGGLTVILTQPATYTGTTVIGTSTLQLNNQTTFASNTTIAGGGVIDFNQTVVTTANVTGQITGGGAVLINGAGGTGSVQLTNPLNSYTGGTTVAGGTLIVNPIAAVPGVPGTGIVDNGTVDFQAAGTYNGPISGTGGISVEAGAGNTLILNQPVTYSGTTVVNTGTLQLNNFVTFSSNTTVASGAVIDFNPLTGPGTVSGSITGAGGVLINGAGGTNTVILTNGANNYTGGTTVAAGTLQINNINAVPGVPGVGIVDNGTVDFETFGTYNGPISGSGKLIVGAGVGNTLRLTQPATYTGTTTVNSGTLELDDQTTFSSAVTLNAGTAIDFNQTIVSPATVSGQISGSGSVLINGNAGTGKIIFTNPSNNYTGGTTIFAGILQGDTGSLQGSILINNPGSLNFNQSGTGTFNGTVSGNGFMNFIGPGQVNFNTNSPAFAGQTTVSNGILALNAILGGNATATSSGTLAGIGSLLGNLTIGSGGKISPGNNGVPGTFNVGGNYLQQSNGTYQIFVNDATASLINASGTATLQNGSIAAANFNISHLPFNQTVTVPILHANGGLTGTFTTVTSNNPFIIPTVTYDLFNAFLNYITPVGQLVSAETRNQRNVRAQLETIINPSPALEAVLVGLLQLDPAQQRLVLDQMGGQQYTDAIIIAENSAHQFIRRLYNPLRAIIGNPHCPVCVCDDFDYLGWSEISGGRSFYDGNKNAKGFKSSSFEVSLGGQATFYNEFTTGLAASYEVNHIHYNIGGHERNRTFLGGVYALYRPVGYYVLGDFVLGHSCGLMTRQIDIGDLHYRPQSKPLVTQATGYAEIGKDCGWRLLLLQPFFGVEVGDYHLSGLREKKGDPLNLVVSKRAHTNVFTRLGMHVTPLNECMAFDFSLDLAWRYRCTSLGDTIHVRFQDFGSAFEILGFSQRRSSIEAAVNFAKQFDDHWRGYAEISGQGWIDAVSYTLVGGIQATW